MKPYGNTNRPWEICGYCDTYYTGDNGTQKSVTGYIVLIHGSVIAWNFQSQKKVTLHVTES